MNEFAILPSYMRHQMMKEIQVWVNIEIVRVKGSKGLQGHCLQNLISYSLYSV